MRAHLRARARICALTRAQVNTARARAQPKRARSSMGLGSGRDRPSAQDRYTQSGARLRKPATTQRRPGPIAARRCECAPFNFACCAGHSSPVPVHVGTWARTHARVHRAIKLQRPAPLSFEITTKVTPTARKLSQCNIFNQEGRARERGRLTKWHRGV